jgi:hypothetical protein
MKERNENQENTFRLPPAWCGAICRNSMNEICVEHCAAKRDCSAFEPKQDLKLADMPRFPLNDSAEMTKEEKFTSVTVYLAKVVDHLQGNEDEAPVVFPGASKISINEKVAEVSSSLKDLQRELVGGNRNTSHEIQVSQNIPNKEQE